MVFGGIEQLAPALQPAATEVQSFCSRDVNMEGGSKPSYDWGNFMARVGARPNSDLTATKISNTTITQKKAEAAQIVDAVLNFLLTGLSVVMSPTNIGSLKNTIETGFKNLKQESKGFVYRTVSETSSSWEYNILFSVEVENNADYFMSFLSTFKVTADYNRKQLFGITLNSVSNYSVEIQATKLFVSKNFRMIFPNEVHAKISNQAHADIPKEAHANILKEVHANIPMEI
ncbi:hypothetical protein BGZ89_005665 [Linnemannia elongata]|nr:hypothetical protein BGZ89_005665 [Linnemannia elongata]